MKDYRSRFYSQKIRALFTSALVYFTLLFVTFYAIGDSQDEISNGFFVLFFGALAATILIAMGRINAIRYKRTEDAWLHECKRPKEERSSRFFAIRTDNSIVIIILMGVVLLTLLGILAGTGMPTPLYFVFMATLLGVVIMQLSHNKKLKTLSERKEHLLKTTENIIYWEDEIRVTVTSGLIKAVWGLILMAMALSDGMAPEGTLLFLTVNIIILIVMITRVISLRRMSDEEALERWEKHQEEEKKAAAKKKSVSTVSTNTNDEFTITKTYNKTIPPYCDCESFPQLCESFVHYAADNGISVSLATAQEIFAAMAASRAVWLCHKNQAYARLIAVTLQRFFTDFDEIVKVSGDEVDQSILFRKYLKDGIMTDSPFESQLLTAKHRTNSVNVIALNVTGYGNFKKVFAPLIDCIRAPEGENSIAKYASSQNVNEGHSIALTQNTWFVFIAPKREIVPFSIRPYSSIVELVYAGEECVEVLPKAKEKVLPYSRFNELISEASQDHFLSLDVWKKFDKLEEYLYESVKFSITNPMARQIEAYSSVLLSCDVPVMEVVDKIIVGKIFPALYTYKKEEINQEGNTIAELLDSLFGMDNIPLCQKVISDRNWA